VPQDDRCGAWDDKLFIISTGGGIVTVERNIKILRDNFFVIYLRTTAEKLIFNLEERGVEKNPLLKGDFRANALALLEARGALYELAAHRIVDVDCEFSVALERLCAVIEEFAQ
jgi:shikimate kinase